MVEGSVRHPGETPMARPRAKQPTYYASRGAYYCWHDGKQHLCAVGPEGDKDTLIQAFETWEQLKRGSGSAGDDTTVSACLAIYLHWIEQNKKPKTLEMRKAFSRNFRDWCGMHVEKTLTV